MLADDEHSSNMQWRRSRNELWKKEKAKERIMMLGVEVAVPEAVSAKETVSSSRHPRHRETKQLVHRKRASYWQGA